MVTDHSDSPGEVLASLLSKDHSNPETLFLTGDFGAGKTLFCLELAARARQRDIVPAGLISPGIYRSGKKVGIDLLDVRSGERRQMAVYRPGETTPNATPLNSLNWIFDESVLEWGNQVLDRLTGGRLLIIDEVGPLELLHGVGWTAGLRLLDSRSFDLSVVVIRPSLLTLAEKRWSWARPLPVRCETRTAGDFSNPLSSSMADDGPPR